MRLEHTAPQGEGELRATENRNFEEGVERWVRRADSRRRDEGWTQVEAEEKKEMPLSHARPKT